MKYRSGLLLLLTSTSEFLGFHASNLGVFHDSIYGSSFRVVEGNGEHFRFLSLVLYQINYTTWKVYK